MSQVLQRKALLQACLKAVNKGRRTGLELLFDCTRHAVIKWAIHAEPPLPDSLGEVGTFLLRRLCTESWAGPAALALAHLRIIWRCFSALVSCRLLCGCMRLGCRQVVALLLLEWRVRVSEDTLGHKNGSNKTRKNEPSQEKKNNYFAFCPLKLLKIIFKTIQTLFCCTNAATKVHNY